MELDIKPNIKYGIMLSGGLDSAVLLWLILAEFKSKNIKVDIQPFTVPKYDGSVIHAQNIINYMNNKFGIDLPNLIPVGNPNLHHSKQGPSGYSEIKNKHRNIDILFFGSNKNPPIELPGVPSIRKKPTGNLAVFPFYDIYKTEILNIAIKNNMHDLFNITHSCTEKHDSRCNVCWQCREREWAFTTLNIIDTGSI